MKKTEEGKKIIQVIEDAGRTMEKKADDRLELGNGEVKPRGSARKGIEKRRDKKEVIERRGEKMRMKERKK